MLTKKKTVIKDYYALETILKKNQEKIWEGYNFTNQPSVLVLWDSTILAFHLHSENPQWQKIDDNLQTSSIDHWKVTKLPMQADFPIDGKKAFLFHLQDAKIDTGLRIFVHERFHVFQHEHFVNTQNIQPKLSNYENIENLTLAFLENRMLIDFIQGNRNSLEPLKNFLTLHSIREKLLSEDTIAWEDEQQRMEGLAEYVSHRTLELAGTYPKQEIIISLLQDERNPENKDFTIHRRHYGVGAVLAMALDYMKVEDWKNKIQNNKQSLVSMLRSAVVLSDDEIQERFKVIKLRYRYDKIFSTLTTVSEHLKNEIAVMLEEYHKTDGIVVEVNVPPQVKCMGGGTNLGMLFVDNGSRLIIADTSTTSTEDDKWMISLKQMPYHFQCTNGTRVFKESKLLEFTIDNQKRTLESLLVLKEAVPFQTLKWEGDRSSFHSVEYPGKISVQDGKVSILYQ